MIKKLVFIGAVFAFLQQGVFSGELYVADQSKKILVFDTAANGDVAPLRTVSGTNTYLDNRSPQGMAVDTNFMYVTVRTNGVNEGGIAVFPLTASGDTEPLRLISGDVTLLNQPHALTVDSNYIYVAEEGKILIFDLSANGNVAPARTISGSSTKLSSPQDVAVTESNIYVANYHGNSITVYDIDANGDAAPTREIKGANTALSYPEGIAVDLSGNIYVTDMSSQDQVKVFSASANGDVAPERTITGSNTGIWGPWGIDVDENYLYVGCFAEVLTFNLGADGNVAPVRVIDGLQTELKFAQGVAVLNKSGRDTPEPPHDPTSLDRWTWRNPLPSGFTVYDITEGDGKWVAAGYGGSIFTGSPTNTWQMNTITSNSLNGITYGGGQFIAVGINGAILTSPDAVTWSNQQSGTRHYLHDVIYDGVQYIVGGSTFMMTSSNGQDWSIQNIDAPRANWNSVACNMKGTYVAAGWGGTNGAVVCSSGSATNWIAAQLPEGELAPWGVTYGNGQFVIAGYDQIDSKGMILTSPNGVDWTRQTIEAPSEILRNITYGGGKFIVVGGSGRDTVYTSSDGTNWVNETPGLIDQELYSVEYDAGSLIACGSGGIFLHSADSGSSWDLLNPGSRSIFTSIAYGNGRYVTVSWNSTNLISDDGIHWTGYDPGHNAALNAVAFGNGTFVSVGNFGAICTSSDGINWQEQTNEYRYSFNDVIFADGSFYAAGGGKTAITSTNGVDWSQISGNDFLYTFQRLAYHDGILVGVGHDLYLKGFVGSITNGGDWVLSEGAPDIFYGAAYGAGRFVGVGMRKTVVYSEDGVSWQVSDPLWDAAENLDYLNGRFVVCGNSSIMTSEDGQTWVTRAPRLETGVNDITFANDTYVGAGAQGFILTSTPVTHYVNISNTTPVSPYISWDTAATNIPDALSACCDGDNVLVADGTYIAVPAVNVTNAVSISSVNGAEKTMITGAGQNRCIEIENAGASLCGFTLTGGLGAVSKPGAGAYMTGGLISQCIISGNAAQDNGGGLCIDGAGVISNSMISGNTSASRGGGIRNNGGTVTRCVIVSNTAVLFGGGIDVCNTGRVTASAILYNFCTTNSGGVAGGICLSTHAAVFSCLINENRASDGGGAYLFANTTIEGCMIVSNLAWDYIGGGNGSGGGVSCNETNTMISRCIIDGNEAQEFGGGIHMSGGMYDQYVINTLVTDNKSSRYGGGTYVNLAPSAYAFQNCTFAGNRATNEFFGDGGGICSGSGQNFSIINCILYSNYAAHAGANYHVVDGGTVSGYNNCTYPVLNSVSGNIQTYPAFADPVDGNYRLSSGSPCIDTGTNQAWMTSAVDLDGAPRIYNNIVDMGAYEYGSPTPGGDAVTVTLLTPTNGAIYSENTDVSYMFSAWANQSGAVITQVLLKVNAETAYDGSDAFHAGVLTNLSAGTYHINAIARDSLGNVATSQTATINLCSLTTRFFSPSDGVTSIAPANITLDARVETIGSLLVTQAVVLANDSPVLTYDTRTDYLMIYTNLPSVSAGTYQYKIQAWNDLGYTTTSETHTVYVVDPAITIDQPTNGTTCYGGTNVPFSFTVTPDSATITQYQLKANSSVIWTGTVDNGIWTNVPSGTYSLIANAFLANGAVAVSPAVTVNVRSPIAVEIISITPDSGQDEPVNISISAAANQYTGQNITQAVLMANSQVIYTNLATATNVPVAYVWSNITHGTYSFTCAAWDSAGNYVVSSPWDYAVKSTNAVALSGPYLLLLHE